MSDSRYKKSASKSFTKYEPAAAFKAAMLKKFTEPDHRVRLRARADGSFDVVVFDAIPEPKKA